MKYFKIQYLSFLCGLFLCMACEEDMPNMINAEEKVAILVDARDITISLVENPENGIVLFQPNATVENALPEELSYSLISQEPANAIFLSKEIVKGKAVYSIKINDASLFDYEKRQTITAIYSATVGSVTDIATITLNITDVVEAIQ